MRLRRRDDTPREPPAEQQADLALLDRRWELATEALEAVPVGVVVEDADGITVLANSRATAPLGDLTGDTLAEVALRRAMNRARAGDAATEAVDIAGTQPRRVEVSAVPLAAGGAVAVVVDASDRLRLDAVRRDFVANVNHELRTPIGALTVLAEALVGESEPSTVERLANRIVAEAARARALIDDLLEFARVEAADQPVHQPVAVADVVEVATARVSAEADRNHIEVTLEVDLAAEVLGDREQLIVAVANLVDNAIKYSDESSTVRVEAALSEDGRSVDVVVRDEGIGIPARDLDRIFERFYRVDQARDRCTGGTGLGLAIVRHVAANHGGEVTVESIEGVGSTFTLRLPVRSAA